MKNKENIKLIPKLRFLSFPVKDWEEKKLQDVFTYLSTNSYSRNLLNNRQGIYQNIHYGDILIKYGSIIDAQKEEIPYLNEDIECTTDNIIMDGDIVMADTAEDEIVGKTSEIFNIGDKKILSGLHTFWLRPLISFAPKYLGYFFNSTQYHNQLLPLIQGVKVSSISKKALNNTVVVYPSISEQQKIADCLSSLDDLIEATAKKVEALKEHKKGLMQRLFPAEGKNVPDLRFPEFQGTSVWEEKKLREIGNFIGGGTPNTTNPEYWDGEILWYTPTEIKNGRLKSSNRKITEQGLRNSSAKLLPKGAILITTRATVGDVAISEKECTTNQGFQSLVVKDSEINSFWFYWIIQHKEELIKRASGSTFKEIGKNEIINIIAYSTKKQEQQKIADCLSSLDELIEATSRKVEILKEHKKGLMQQLFPKI